MKKTLIIANMLFASATVWGMENPATELDLNSRSYYSQKENILKSKHIENFDELIRDWSETNQRCLQLGKELTVSSPQRLNQLKARIQRLRRGNKRKRSNISERRMRSNRIIFSAEIFDQGSSFLKRIKHFSVEQFIA